MSSNIQWQFSGRHGNWHNYRRRDCCPTTSNDIEEMYKFNPKGSMHFIVRGDKYLLDFSKMVQTNTRTGATRAVRRLEQ